MATTRYDTDFDTWAQQQAAALWAKARNQLDIEHLAEEVEGLRKTERNALRSQLRRLASQLLEWHYQPEKRGESRQATIRDALAPLEDGLETSRSLAGLLDTFVVWAYPRARRQAAKATGLPLATFPETCPWSVEQLLDEDFWPGSSFIGNLDARAVRQPYRVGTNSHWRCAARYTHRYDRQRPGSHR